MKRALWLFAALFVLLQDTRVHAGGFDTAYFGGPSGQAVGATPFAVYYNPAALSTNRRVHLALDLMLGFHSMHYRRTETTVPEPMDARGANLGKAKLFDVLGGPSIAGSVRFGDFTLGAGMYAPIAGWQRWRGNSRFDGNGDHPGASDGRARFHLIEGSFLTVNGTLAAAYQIRPLGLSIGGGFNLNYSRLAFVRALTAAFDDAIANGLEQRTDLEASGVTASFSAGLYYHTKDDALSLGASYQAPPGLYDGQVLTGRIRTSLGGIVERNDADLHQTMPDVVRWGVRYRPSEKVELRLFGDYTRWSLLVRQCVTRKGEKCDIAKDGSEKDGNAVLANHERHWRDTFGVNLGASYFFSPRLEGLAGFGYDSNAVPASTLDASLFDSDKVTGTVGARVHLGDHLRLLASYAHTYWLPRDITGESKLDQYAYPSRLPTAGGEYERFLGLVTCLLEATFD